MEFRERFAIEWDDFISSAAGKLMLAMVVLGVLALIPMALLLALI